jgi:uncharacterized protein
VSAVRLAEIFAADPLLMKMLAAVEATGLPDCWIAAGAVRSAVWDTLHGRAVSHDWADVDVLFFDAGDISKTREADAEAALCKAVSGIPWEVRNQARMHLKTGLPPYRDTEDGLRNFAETPTATGVRLHNGTVEVIAPHGLDDLFACISRPVFDDPHMMGFYRARMAAKRWPERWPKVRVLGL